MQLNLKKGKSKSQMKEYSLDDFFAQVSESLEAEELRKILSTNLKIIINNQTKN